MTTNGPLDVPIIPRRDLDPMDAPAFLDDDMIGHISDVVKSWNGFRPRGGYMDSFLFTHPSRPDEKRRPLTIREASDNLGEWVEAEEASAEIRAEFEAHEADHEPTNYPTEGDHWVLVNDGEAAADASHEVFSRIAEDRKC